MTVDRVNLADLKAKTPKDLLSMAKELEIENASTMRKGEMILKAPTTCSFVAPPPTSRKLAGSPPANLMASIVAIARPAPFTRQAMFPSSPM